MGGIVCCCRSRAASNEGSGAGTANSPADGSKYEDEEGVAVSDLALRGANDALDTLITLGEVVPIFGSFFELIGLLRDKWQALVERNDEARNVGNWAKRELRLLAPIRRRVEQLSKEEKDESCAEDGSLLRQAVADAETSIIKLMKIADEIQMDTCCHDCCFKSPRDCCHGLVLKKEDFESAKEDVKDAREFFDRALAVDTNRTVHGNKNKLEDLGQKVNVILSFITGGNLPIGNTRRTLPKVIPLGCEVASLHAEVSGARTVHSASIEAESKAALDTLRDRVVLKTEDESLENALNKTLQTTGEGRISVDRGKFLESYEQTMMRFTRLTEHQREKLENVRREPVAVLLAHAGAGKTFFAIQRMAQVLNSDPRAVLLFVARNTALAFFVCKWLVYASQASADRIIDRIHVLVAPFEDGPRRVRVEAAGARRRLALGAAGKCEYALVVVDEAHHLTGDSQLREELARVNAADATLLFLSDASQATEVVPDADKLARSLVELPREQTVAVTTLSEVVRSTKRIVAGAAAFQLEAGRKAEMSTHTLSPGPPLVARIFRLADDDEGERYAQEVVEAIVAVRRQLADLEDLNDRIAVVGPVEAFVEMLRKPLIRALKGRFELVDAATASSVLPRAETTVRSAEAKSWLVLDSVDNMDGLERLVVICVGLDQVIDRGAGVLETRSRLYRAMTRAQLAVAVVNEVLPGGWLEFLGRVELDADGGFDDAAEREKRADNAADDVVGMIVAETETTSVAKPEQSARNNRDEAEQGTSLLKRGFSDDGSIGMDVVDEADSDAVLMEDKMAAADAHATTPSEAEPMKVLQSIWDASAVATASRGDLRFMPFSEGVDLSKLAELRTLKGHSDMVKCVAVFPDGWRVVSASDDNTLKVWDVATGECVATLEGHSNTVRGVAVFPDGRRVVSASEDRTLKVWDVATGKRVATLKGHSDAVSRVAVFPDGRRVVSGSWDETLKVWDVATGKCVATLEGHSHAVSSVAVFPDGRRVVSGSWDKTLKVWDVATGECVATLEGHSARVNGVAVFPDGRRVVSGSRDKTLKVWDVATGECVATLEGHSWSVRGVAVFPDGRRVVSGSEDETLKVWDVETGECVATLEGHSIYVSSVAVFPDGRRVVSGSNDKTLKVYGLSPS